MNRYFIEFFETVPLGVEGFAQLVRVVSPPPVGLRWRMAYFEGVGTLPGVKTVGEWIRLAARESGVGISWRDLEELCEGLDQIINITVFGLPQFRMGQSTSLDEMVKQADMMLEVVDGGIIQFMSTDIAAVDLVAKEISLPAKRWMELGGKD